MDPSFNDIPPPTLHSKEDRPSRRAFNDCRHSVLTLAPPVAAKLPFVQKLSFRFPHQSSAFSLPISPGWQRWGPDAIIYGFPESRSVHDAFNSPSDISSLFMPVLISNLYTKHGVVNLSIVCELLGHGVKVYSTPWRL